jgi:hypothetical protein
MKFCDIDLNSDIENQISIFPRPQVRGGAVDCFRQDHERQVTKFTVLEASTGT